MANSSQIPVTGLPGYRSEISSRRIPTLRPMPPTTGNTANGAHDSASLPATAPRKLVRPTLPARSVGRRAFSLHEESPILAHQNMAAHAATQESSHAEAFYYQKQVQAQTPMMVVLDDGQRIEGCIEWYDRNSIKLRGASRTLIYKSAIKYIYKLAEPHP